MKRCVLFLVAFAVVCASCGGNSSAPPPLGPAGSTVAVPGLMNYGRITTAVTLNSGDVLEVGGFGTLSATFLASGEVYHPATNSFSLVSNQLGTEASRVCLAPLPDGTALEAGGRDNNFDSLTQAEIYDPSTNRFTPTKAAMETARYGCSATTLSDGTVLIAGGLTTEGESIDTAEIYDPGSGTFTFTKGTMVSPRAFQNAVRLANGEVLLVGGLDGTTTLASAELYNPTSGTFTATAGSLNTARDESAALLLADGRVLVAGGSDGTSALSTAELYDPSTSTFSFTANDMSIARRLASAALLPDGDAIVGAGSSAFPSQQPLASCDLFDPSTNSFAPTGPLHIARMDAAAAVLPNGSPIFLGGIDEQGTSGGNYEPSGEIYNPATGTFSVTGGLNSLRVAYASALLPDGRVLLAGGATQEGPLDSAEVFDPTTGYFTPTANNLNVPRVSLNAVTLNDGMVLIVGGSTGETAELFDPTTMSFTPTTGSTIAAFSGATATLLPDGTVLIAGGFDSNGNPLATAEIYNPTSQTFSATVTPMTSPRAFQTATLLADGTVLIAGGTASESFSGALDSAEIYEPTSGEFSPTGMMTGARVNATANLLQDGRVLIAGGTNTEGDSVATADLYNPKTGLFTAAPGVMSNSRVYQSAVSLPDGRVMIAGGSIAKVAGGVQSIATTDTVDFFDPATGLFQAGVPMLSQRDFFTATLLNSGKVLLPGGRYVQATGVGLAILETAEIYTP